MDPVTSYIITPGTAYPFGAHINKGKVNFALFTSNDIAPTLCIYSNRSGAPLLEITFDPKRQRTGKVWHTAIENLPSGLCYGYRYDQSDNDWNGKLLIDPYAKAVVTNHHWNPPGANHYAPLGAILETSPFDWQGDAPLLLPLEEMIIYEMHLRAFTADPSSKVANPGTYKAAIEKIPYLRDLGINAVELLPIHEFNETEYRLHNPINKEQLCNLWGYSTVNFFSIMGRYAVTEKPEEAINEFKEFVRVLHQHGIEVILDVVYNHSAEGNEKGPILNYKAFANNIYYLLDENGNYSNYSGCGNTLNCNHPVVIEMILASLRYWVTEMHIDGFRFDLATILCRGEHGHILPTPPLIKAIGDDPILANTKLIAEPWDAVGGYQVGSFGPRDSAWCEWNGRYRDSIRKFIKGSGSKKDFATRFCGSEDLYHGRHHGSRTSINFVTAHDGFTLTDLVSYNQKHNIANGENNRDGSSFNDSWNCGEEGISKNSDILTLRHRQMRNFHLAHLLSQGIPMLLMGDEYGHSKLGNNNTWCQDNTLNWFLWDLQAKSEFFNFYRALIHFRKNHPAFNRRSFLSNKDIIWHSTQLEKPLWDEQNNFIAMTIKDPSGKRDLYLAFNTCSTEITTELPSSTAPSQWYWVVNTANTPPNDFLSKRAEPMNEQKYTLKAYSAILLENEL